MDSKRNNPEFLLILLSVATSLAFSVWQVLLNNFAVEQVAFTGREIGVLQSLREVPGFLAFTVVFVLLLIREQTFAMLSLALLGAGMAAVSLLLARLVPNNPTEGNEIRRHRLFASRVRT